MNAEIIAVGSELLTPHRQDTNSLYLTEQLNDLGVEVRFKCIVGDDREGLTAAAKLAMRRSDIIIVLGRSWSYRRRSYARSGGRRARPRIAPRSGDRCQVGRTLRQARHEDVGQQCQAGRRFDQRSGVAQLARHRARPVDRRQVRRPGAVADAAARSSVRNEGDIRSRMSFRDCAPGFPSSTSPRARSKWR